MFKKNKPLSLLLTLIFTFVFLTPAFLLPAEAAAAAPTVTALKANSIDDDSATLNGRLASEGTYDVVEYGFYYGKSRTIDASNTKKRAGSGDLDADQGFSAAITNLDPDTRYYFRAYIVYQYSSKTRRTVLSSQTLNFTTTDSAAEYRPEVSTDAATSITSSSAKLNGEIDSIGISRITEYGFYYGTKSTPSTKKKVGSRIDEGDDFSYKLTGLKSDTRYYFRAYARNAEGISYGSVRSFSTKKGNEKPSVTTKAVTTGDGYATLYGVVTDKGDSGLEAYGFYYGTTSNTPTRIKVGNSIAEDKTFSHQLTGLAPGSYYVKAYATNDEGTSYGTLRRFDVTGSSAPSVFFIGSSYYSIRGTYQAGEAAPYIKNSRTYLPIRPVGNSVGIADEDIVWNASARTVTLTKGSTTVRLEIGSPIMYVNGSAVRMDTAPEISNSRACLPIAHVVKTFGYTAYWDGTSRAVTIR